MSLTLIVLLRAIHVIASSFWLGIMLLNAAFLLPAIRNSGPAGGQVMKQLVQARRLPSFINAAVVTSLTTGAIVLWWVSGGFSAAWTQSGQGLGLLTGAALAILVALMGQFVNGPTARRLGQISAQLPNLEGASREATMVTVHQLQSRLIRSTTLAASVLTMAAFLMATARFLG